MTRSLVPRLANATPAMARMDRLGWTAGIAFESYGTHFGVRVNDARVLERLPEYLPPGHQPGPWSRVDHLYSLWSETGEPHVAGASHGRPVHRLYAGAECLQAAADPDELLKTLESSLHFETAQSARQHLFVHAGVVGWRGQAILLPGRSFSGKTSLVAALVRAGATYGSDEYAVLDSQGRVHPYPKPLSIRRRTAEGTRRCPVEALGGQAMPGPLPVGLVAALVYKPAAVWQPHPLSPGQILMALLDNTVLVRDQPEVALSTLGLAAEQSLGLTGERGEADQVVPLLLEWFSRHVGSGLESAAAGAGTGSSFL
jgi:hypothetical protein